MNEESLEKIRYMKRNLIKLMKNECGIMRKTKKNQKETNKTTTP